MEYCARDTGGGLHIPVEGMMGEIENADASRLGEVMVTNLLSRAMPIIRFRTGDIADLAPEICGRGLLILKKMYMKSVCRLYTPDGRVIHALALIYVLRECPQIEKFQVVQESIEKITANIVPRKELKNTVKEKIIRDLQKVLGNRMAINVALSSEIPTTASGKFRYVISKVSGSG